MGCYKAIILKFRFVPLHYMNYFLKGSIVLFFSSVLSLTSFGQAKKVEWQPNGRALIQFSGMVVGSDSLEPIPFTSLIVKNTQRGTISDYFGYFSFVAQTSDTIEFAALGYRNGYFVIPDTLSSNKYSLIEVLKHDTIYLKEAVIYPWPTQDQFKRAFLDLKLPDDDLVRAKNNLESESLREKIMGMPADASLNYKYQMQERYTKLYYAGQYPSISLLDPVAWSKFIKAWQRGDFKNK